MNKLLESIAMNLPSHESCRSFRERSVSIKTLASLPRRSVRTAFTLVELMMVIVIIGILAGLAIPAIMRAISTANEGAYKQEIDTLADAVEKYRTKYGDYPPDGSSWQIMERHLRKAFPQIQQSELNLLNPTTTAALTDQGF
jgi:prepilin-type N-terminal cleavage/methylation domain-containing protein